MKTTIPAHSQPIHGYKKSETISRRYFAAPTSDEKVVNSPETNELLHPELYYKTSGNDNSLLAENDKKQMKQQFNRSITALKEQLENLKTDIEKRIENETYSDKKPNKTIENAEISSIENTNQKTAKTQIIENSIISQNETYNELIKKMETTQPKSQYKRYAQENIQEPPQSEIYGGASISRKDPSPPHIKNIGLHNTNKKKN